MKNVLIVLCGNVLRLGSGMLVFVFLARLLGPSIFGEFSLLLAIATILTLPINFGFSPYLLRIFGAEPDYSYSALSSVLTAKLIISLFVLLIAFFAFFFYDLMLSSCFILILFAQIFDSFNDFYVLLFRLDGRYKSETTTASFIALLHIAIMLAGGHFFQNLIGAAAVFMISRFIGLLITIFISQYKYKKIKTTSITIAFNSIKSAKAYFFDFAMMSIYNQLDVFIIRYYLGATGLGIYQAGMKLVQGASRFAPIAAMVILPTLSKNNGTHLSSLGAAVKSIAGFIFIGLILFLILVLGRDIIVNVLFGDEYALLIPILPVFGLVLMIKFIESGSGLILIAKGLQAKKTWLVLIQIIMILTLGIPMVKYYGQQGWLWTYILMTALLITSYGMLFSRKIRIKNTN